MAVTGTPRVRPGLRRLAIGAFVILIPVAALTAWDHYEARCLRQLVDRLQAAGEPVTTVRPTGARTDAMDNAARYYEAAAALVGARDLYRGLNQRLEYRPEGDREALLQDIRSWLESNREAEGLLARATSLPFEGYAPGTQYSYRFDRLHMLSRLASLRTLERLEAGDSGAATAAIAAQLRLSRPLMNSGASDLTSYANAAWASGPALAVIGRWLDLAPSDQALLQVQTAVRDLDHDGALAQSVMSERAMWLERVWDAPGLWYARPPRDASPRVSWSAVRPLVARRARRTADTLTALLEQARRPWPDRLRVDVPPAPSSTPQQRCSMNEARCIEYLLRSSYVQRATLIARVLAHGRAANAAIGVERYRRANGRWPSKLADLLPDYLNAVPVDPFSGRELIYRALPDGAVVYSVGTNGADDGGREVSPSDWAAGLVRRRGETADLGVVYKVAPAR